MSNDITFNPATGACSHCGAVVNPEEWKKHTDWHDLLRAMVSALADASERNLNLLWDKM